MYVGECVLTCVPAYVFGGMQGGMCGSAFMVACGICMCGDKCMRVYVRAYVDLSAFMGFVRGMGVSM